MRLSLLWSVPSSQFAQSCNPSRRGVDVPIRKLSQWIKKWSNYVARVDSERNVKRRKRTPRLEELEPRIVLDTDWYVVPGSPLEQVSVTFKRTAGSTPYKNELGYYIVSDNAGRVEGLLPSDPGYAAAVNRTSKSLFSTSSKAGASSKLTVAGGTKLGFYLVQNSNSTNWKANNPDNALAFKPVMFFSFEGANPDGADHVRSATVGGETRYRWEDRTNLADRDFNDMMYSITAERPKTFVPGEIGQLTPTTFTLTSTDSSFRNELGLFLVDDAKGTIGGIAPGQPGYTEAALKAETSQVLFVQGAKRGIVKTVNLPAGKYFGLYLVQNRTTAKFLEINPENKKGKGHVFFSILAANPDKFNHIRWFSSTSFGFEDLTGGGDKDFNDLIAKFKFGTPFTPNNPNNNFPNDLAGWTVAERGGSAGSRGTVTVSNKQATMTEGSSFVTTLSRSFTIPANPSPLSFQYNNLAFDRTDPGFVNDAFEVALLDGAGYPLTATIAPGRDVFFNSTDSNTNQTATGVSTSGLTVSLDLSAIPVGTVATLVFRLVNNDSDTATKVTLASTTLPTTTTAEGPVKFFVVDGVTSKTHRYGEEGLDSGIFTAAGATLRGAASTPAGDKVWLIDASTRRVTLVEPNGNQLASWIATDASSPQGVTVHNGDLWLVDRIALKVLRFEGGMERAIDASSTDSFSLNAANASPSDLVTDGSTVWVTDDVLAEVFVYDMAGLLLGRWKLDADNAAPSGITRNPAGGTDLWVVDRTKKVVFHYPDGCDLRNEQATAAGTFVLGPGNSSPEGIADPPQTEEGYSLLDIDGRAVYDTADDFRDGAMFNVTAIDDVGEIRLNAVGDTEIPPFIWVANSSQGSVSRFDTRTGVEVGRYRTGPESLGARLNPSRTSVAGDGSAWVANRSNRDANTPSSVVHVMLEGFVDRNGNGVMDTSSDSNQNGKIDLNEMLPWDANNDGLPDDERIAISIGVGRDRNNTNQVLNNTIARALAIDANDNVWVGLYNQQQYEVYDGVTGNLLKIVPVTGTPYGAVIDGNGLLWGATNGNNITRVDTNTLTAVPNITNVNNYGITASSDGAIWTAGYGSSVLTRIEPITLATTNYTASGFGAFRGVGVDDKNNVWVATNSPNGIVRFHFDSDMKTLLSTQGVTINGTATAAVVDADGFVWTTTQNTNLLYKIDPETLSVVPGWPIASGPEPYNYSDMTGRVRLQVTQRTGTWTETLDAERNGAVWAGIGMEVNTPADSSVVLRVRSSDTAATLSSLAWRTITQDTAYSDITGRYLQVEVRLQSTNPTATPSVRSIEVASVLAPSLEVYSPLVGIELPVDSIVILEGVAQAAQPEFGPALTVRNRITAVMVNGQPVELLDDAGRFYTRVHIQPGENHFTVVAMDEYGQTTTVVRTILSSSRNIGTIDLSQLVDLSATFRAEYAHTSFQAATKSLYADIAVRNLGQYPAGVPLYVGVKNISDPAVQVLNAAGTLPDGTPYYDFTGLVTGGATQLAPNAATGTLSLPFSNPNRTRFTYDLVYLGVPNRSPNFISIPELEATVSREYLYDANAVDPDGDALTFALLSGPTGMVISPISGVISWTPAASEIGNFPVSVQVNDGRGGTALQNFTIVSEVSRPNRPPVFTTLPVVEVNLGDSYTYDVNALDPDQDNLTYNLDEFPIGMTIDPTTGAIRWTPLATQLGHAHVTVTVNDGQGGIATQKFEVCVEAGNNRPPIIVSEPVTTLRLGEQQVNVIALNDEWTLTNRGFATARDTYQFVRNIAQAFTDGKPGRFLAYDDGYRLQSSYGNPEHETAFGGSSLNQALSNAGIDLDISATPLNLNVLQSYDAVLLAGLSLDVLLLQQYIAAGGKVLIAGGTGRSADFGWNTFLESKGLQFANGYNGIAGNISIDSNDSLFTGVSALYQDNGQSIIDLNPQTGGQVLVTTGANGLYAKANETVRADIITVGSNHITPTTALPTAGNFTIDQIADGITGDASPFNGFASPSASGTITLNLDQSYDLSGFILWNDINVLAEGIAHFRLDFFDSGLAPLGSTGVYLAPNGQVAPATFNFATVRNVARVDLVVLDSNRGTFERIEIREVAFLASTTGTATYIYDVDALDPDGGPSTYSLTQAPPGMTIDADTGVIRWAVDDERINLIRNGGFESPDLGTASQQVISTGSSALSGWTISGTSGIDLVSTFWQPSEGRQSISLNWKSPSTISQILTTVPGQSYRVSFDLAGEAFGGQSSRTLDVLWNGVAVSSQSFNYSGQPPTAMGWTTVSVDVLGTGSDILSFRSTTPNNYGPTLDNVRVVASATGFGQSFPVAVRVDDGVGGSSEQVFTVSILNEASEQHVSFTANIASDNYFAFYTGAPDGSNITYHGRDTDGGYWSVFSYDVTAGADDHLYIVGWDVGAIAMVIGDFDDVNGQLALVTGIEEWEGAFAGVNPMSGDAPTPAALAEQIASLEWLPIDTSSLNGQEYWGFYQTLAPTSNYIWLGGFAQYVIGNKYLILRSKQPLRNYFDVSYVGPAGSDLIVTGVSQRPNTLGSIELSAVVTNDGAPVLPGVPVAFYDGNPTRGGRFLSTALTTQRLTQGQSENVSFTVPAGSVNDLWVRVDDDGTGIGIVPEYDETNNAFRAGIDLDPVNYAPKQTRSFTTTELNATIRTPHKITLPVLDPDGDDITYEVLSGPEGLMVHQSLGVVAWYPLRDQVGEHQTVIRATDTFGNTTLVPFTLTVTTPNTAPIFISTPTTEEATVDRLFEYHAFAQDAEQTDLTFALVNPVTGMNISQDGVFSWTPTNSIPATVTIRVSDGELTTDQIFTLHVASSADNTNPTLKVEAPSLAWLGRSYVARLIGSDAESDAVRYELVNGPAGMAVDAVTGILTWSPTATGFETVRVKATDGQGGETEAEFSVTITSEASSNRAPVIISNPPRTAMTGMVYAYNLVARDPDGGPVVWSLVSAPHGMSLDSEQGTLRWNPADDQTGMFTVTVRAMDQMFAFGEQTFTIQVSCSNSPPVISSRPPTVAYANEQYLYALRATDPEGDPLTFELTTAPTGMFLVPGTSLIRWLPTTVQAGRHDVVIRVTDQAGNETTQAFSLLVSTETPNRAPTFSSRPILGATIGREYSYTVVARDSDGDPLSFALTSAPAGMTIDAGGRILWTPSAPAQANVTIEVTDARGGVAVQSYTITARANQAPVVETIPNATAALQGTFRTAVRATDPEGDALTFSLVQAPTGMTIDNEGRISWTPTGNPRSEVIRVQVADTSGLSATTEFTLSLILDNEAPRVNLTLSRTTVQFGTAVQIHVSATDNVGIGSLHLTVTQNGVISEVPLNASGFATFTPPVIGRYTFTASATDTTGNTATSTADLFASDPNAQSDVRSSFTRLEMLTAPGTYESFAPSDDTGDPIPELSYLTDVYGTIESVGQPLAYWRLLMARGGEVDILNVDPNHPAWQVIGSGESLVSDGKLGTFDPTMLPNDSYVLAIVAYDVTGSGWVQPSLVSVTGNAKLGDFRLEFTDLTLPLNGIPITINRVYDTKDSYSSSDFGYGWSLGVRDAKIRETVSAGELFIPARTKVYLTAPDGNRVGFTYHEVRPQGSWFGTIWQAEFRGDAGHNYKLTISDTNVTRGGILGALGGEGINPSYYILTTPDGTKYEYDQATGLKKISDTNGNTVTFTPTAITHSGGRVISLERDGSGRISAIRLPDGSVGVRYRYSAAGDLIEVKQVTETTPVEKVLASTISYRTDRAHYLDEYTDANGNRAVKTVYDASGRLVGVTDANGNTATQEFDAANFTETVRDARGNPTHITYNDRGNVTRSVQPTEFGDIVMEYEYADPNNPDKETKIINGRGFVTTRSHDAAGNLLSETTPDGTTSYQYNSLNKLTQVTDTLGRVTAYGYDLVGNLVRVATPNGESSSFTYDAQGRVATFTDFSGNLTRFTDYCSCGRPLTIINPDLSFRTSESNQYSQVTKSTDERGFVTRNEYDNQGRLTKVIDGEGNVTRYEYTGANQTKVIDGLGNETRYEYDALNRRTKIIDAEGGITSFGYDANGNMERVTDPVGNVTRFVFDTANRVKEEIDPLGKSKYFEYDAAGNKLEITDRNGRVRQFVYDGTNRQTAELWLDATGSTIRTITSQYDAVGNLLYTADPDAELSYTYDGMNRMTTATTVYPVTNVAPVTLIYGYDANGNLASVTDNTGVVVASTYDNRNRLETRSWSGGGIDAASVKYTYFANSQVDTLTRYADITQTNMVGQSSYTYLDNGLTESITHTDGTEAVLAGYVYTYNAGSLLTRETHHGDTYHYGYDKTGQLLTVNKNGSLFESFSYDANGNRKTSTGPNGNQTYVPAGLGNQLLNNGLFGYTYDNEGNLQTKTELATGNVSSYTWDHRNRLTKVEERTAGGIIVSISEYGYDPTGRRILQEVNGQSLFTVYDSEHAWTDVKVGEVDARYLFGDRIDNILVRWKSDSSTAWYLGDKLGTIRDLVGATGSIINHIDYSAYGHILSLTNSYISDRFTFTGREYDSTTLNYFNRMRYYNPSTGSFASLDPISFDSSSFNLYAYALNNPITYTDPSGLYGVDYSLLAHNALAAFSKGVIAYVFIAPIIDLSLCLIPQDVREKVGLIETIRKGVKKPMQYVLKLAIKDILGPLPVPFEISDDQCNWISRQIPNLYNA